VEEGDNEDGNPYSEHFGKKLTTGCGDIAYSPVGYFILSHPVFVNFK